MTHSPERDTKGVNLWRKVEFLFLFTENSRASNRARAASQSARMVGGEAAPAQDRHNPARNACMKGVFFNYCSSFDRQDLL